MKKILSIAVVSLLAISAFAILAFNVKATDIQFQMQPLIEGPADDGSPYILQDSSGKIWVFFISGGRIDAGYRHVFFITSVDGGITWTEPSLFLPAYLPGVDTVNFVPVFQDSTSRFWVAWTNYWGVHDEDEIWFTTSSDGVIWADAKVLCRHGNKIGSFIETDGKIWFFFSPRLPNYFHTSYITTVDGGNSWSDLVEITSSYDSYPHAMVLSNGTIFVVYNHYPHTIGYCSSSDGGLTWSNTLFNNPEYDSVPFVIEYGGKIYVFFRRQYQEWLLPSDIWFRVYDETGWGPFQQMTNDPQNFDNGPVPAIINNQIWIVWGRGDPGAQLDIWLAKLAPEITWEYVFEDSCRGTMLRISTDDQYFQFITPDKTFTIKHDEDMCMREYRCFTSITICYVDDDIWLSAYAVDGRWDFCLAYVKDVQTGYRYLLLDKLGTE